MLSRVRGVGPGSGFWIVAVVFVVTMAYSTVPTPLYPLYEQRDDFPVSLVTVIYSAFAVGVMLSLYLFGHVSDWLGRRSMLVIAGVALLLVPETVVRPAPLPRYRPQKLSVPRAGRSIFLVAAFGAFAGFAVFGLFSSLIPTFLAGEFGERDHLLAGVTVFAIFGASAAGQLALVSTRLRTRSPRSSAACAGGWRPARAVRRRRRRRSRTP